MPAKLISMISKKVKIEFLQGIKDKTIIIKERSEAYALSKNERDRIKKLNEAIDIIDDMIKDYERGRVAGKPIKLF